MANLTKNQIKARLKKIVEKLEEIKSELDDLAYDTQEEADNIEPYGDKWELTEQQEERQEYLTDLATELESQSENLDQVREELDNLIY